jgi:hypothetical protein
MELHQKYAPILHFNKEERFFPMRLEDILAYCSLRLKGQDTVLVPQGQVTPDTLVKYGQTPEVYLRSVQTGPGIGSEVISTWSHGTLETVLRWADATTDRWTDDLAQKAYSWFSPKTKVATQLFWWNGLLSEVLQGAVQSVSADELPRLLLPRETRDSAVERYQTQKKKSAGYTYYYRQVKDGPYLCLQYWFFYGYNDWGQSFAGLNDHEGDWEGIMLFFRLDSAGRPQEPPAYITYADHESRTTKPWGHPDTAVIGTHPVVYVGGGSHASYMQSTSHTVLASYDLVDRAAGDGLTIDQDDWVHRIDLDTLGWLRDYQGSWGTRFWLSTAQAYGILQLAIAANPLGGLIGLASARQQEIQLPGVSAPRGPVGPHRPQYAMPVAWAGVPV